MFDEPDQPHAYRSANLLLDDLDPRALATLPELAGPSEPVIERGTALGSCPEGGVLGPLQLWRVRPCGGCDVHVERVNVR